MLSPQFLAKLRSLPTAGELGRIIERGSEKLVHLALCLRRGHVLGWAKRPLPPAVHQYIYGPFKPVECRNRGLAFGGDEDISAKRCECSRERPEEHTSELQSLMRISYAVLCLKKKNKKSNTIQSPTNRKVHTNTNTET